MVQSSVAAPLLSPLNGKPILLNFDGAEMSSDPGLTLLRQVERRAGLAGLIAKCLTDLRAPGKVRHSLEDIIRFRIMMIAAGYEDGNDAAELRDNPLCFAELAQDLKTVWTAPGTDARLKKRIVRTVIHEVVVDLDDATAEIVLLIHWMGGAHTELRLPRRRKGQRNSTSADIVEAVRHLALIAKDDEIAGVLNRIGLLTGNGNRWTRERVTSLRSTQKIQVYRLAGRG